MKKILVAYFSASGETAKLAKTIAGVVDGDLFETAEMNDDNSCPAIATKITDMAQYSAVFVGFPIWWYQAPRIIETFLESYDFAGKTVIPFATSGGSGMGKTNSILKAVCPAAAWLPGKRLQSNESTAAVQKWVNTLKI